VDDPGSRFTGFSFCKIRNLMKVTAGWRGFPKNKIGKFLQIFLFFSYYFGTLFVVYIMNNKNTQL
jgi:hypothetical protein